ncbi:facilitated trehalose transporter Tret1-like [Athalia rosae]|uniref:facilitated trehalose transporter Tret1-like n=1 Tax=Athalia rosae TaxID=37344 RepID=UPI002034985F|nr:facilitated trehalose transporter Tret1-like [Athalia rosae]
MVQNGKEDPSKGDLECSITEGSKLHQYLSTAIVGLTALQIGITLGWTSPVLPFLLSHESFMSVSLTQASWISSSLGISAVFGAIPAGKISDRIGRRLAMIILSIPYLLSWLLVIFGPNIECLYVARCLGGISSGAIGVLALIYIGEIAEPSIRGTLASSFGILIASGTLYAFTAGAYLSYTMFAVSCGILALSFFVLSPFLTESPIWLVKQGRTEDATDCLLRLRGSKCDVKAELVACQDDIAEQETRKGGFRELVSTRAGRRGITTSLGLALFQQLTGVDAVIVYTVLIFQAAGSTIDPFLSAVMLSIVEVIMEVCAGFVVDRIGRRPLLFISELGIIMSLSTIGCYFKFKSSGIDLTDYGWVPLVSLILYMISYSVGFGCIPWIMNGELFSSNTKSVANACTVVLNWSMGALVMSMYTRLVISVGEAVVFWIFSGLMVSAFIFTIFVVPETKGKTLQEIQYELSGKKKKIDEPQSQNAP